MNICIKVDGGIGRCICSTGVIENFVKEKNKEGHIVYVLTPHNFVFDNLEGIERVVNFGLPTLFEDYISKSEYIDVEPYNYRGHYQDKSHLTASWNYLLNGKAEFVKPKIVLTDNELAMGKAWVDDVKRKEGKKVLLFQPFGASGGLPKRVESVCNSAEPLMDESYRSLLMDNVRGLIDKLKDEYVIFLVKDEKQINVNGTLPLTIAPRMLFSILPFVDGVIACDSMLQHACSGVGVKCPVVVFWGGTEPKQFGYKEFLNLEKDMVRLNEPMRLPHDHSYYLRKNKGCNDFSEEFEDKAVEFIKSGGKK